MGQFLLGEGVKEKDMCSSFENEIKNNNFLIFECNGKGWAVWESMGIKC